MCEPTMIMAGVSAVVAAVGSVMQGKAQKDAADYNAQVMQNEASVAQTQADQSVQQAQSEQVKHDRQAALQMGHQRSLLAASGIDMSSGSALNQLVDNTGQFEIDRQNIGYQGQLNQWGYMNKANSLIGQSELEKAKGQSALTAGYMGAASSLIGGAGKVAGGLGSSSSPAASGVASGKPNSNLLKMRSVMGRYSGWEKG